MRAECSASEVANHLSINLQRAHSLLGKLIQVNIAVIERQDARAGRAIKRYRMLGRWFIPYEVTGAETLETFASAQLMPLLFCTGRAGPWSAPSRASRSAALTWSARASLALNGWNVSSGW